MVLSVRKKYQYSSQENESRGVSGQYRGALTPDVWLGDRARTRPARKPGMLQNCLKLFKQKNNKGAI